MVLSAQKELEAHLWICFRYFCELSIFEHFFFASRFEKKINFFPRRFFLKNVFLVRISKKFENPYQKKSKTYFHFQFSIFFDRKKKLRKFSNNYIDVKFSGESIFRILGAIRLVLHNLRSIWSVRPNCICCVNPEQEPFKGLKLPTNVTSKKFRRPSGGNFLLESVLSNEFYNIFVPWARRRRTFYWCCCTCFWFSTFLGVNLERNLPTHFGDYLAQIWFTHKFSKKMWVITLTLQKKLLSTFLHRWHNHINVLHIIILFATQRSPVPKFWVDFDFERTVQS